MSITEDSLNCSGSRQRATSVHLQHINFDSLYNCSSAGKSSAAVKSIHKTNGHLHIGVEQYSFNKATAQAQSTASKRGGQILRCQKDTPTTY